MRLKDWAVQNGVSYQTAWRWVKGGNFPLPVTQTATGMILVHPPTEPVEKPQRVALYARVSSTTQKDDLIRQQQRLRDWAAAKGYVIHKDVAELGSGLNGHRKKLLEILADTSITVIVVEHRDRLGRFGVEYIEAALSASGRNLIVLNPTEQKLDIVQDFVDVVTSMCARIYGARSSKTKAKAALAAVQIAAPEDE